VHEPGAEGLLQIIALAGKGERGAGRLSRRGRPRRLSRRSGCA